MKFDFAVSTDLKDRYHASAGEIGWPCTEELVFGVDPTDPLNL
jgi:hypothetical protein